MWITFSIVCFAVFCCGFALCFFVLDGRATLGSVCAEPCGRDIDLSRQKNLQLAKDRDEARRQLDELRAADAELQQTLNAYRQAACQLVDVVKADLGPPLTEEELAGECTRTY